MHGVSGPVSSNNLDEIIFKQVRDEVDGWRKAGASSATR